MVDSDGPGLRPGSDANDASEVETVLVAGARPPGGLLRSPRWWWSWWRSRHDVLVVRGRYLEWRGGESTSVLRLPDQPGPTFRRPAWGEREKLPALHTIQIARAPTGVLGVRCELQVVLLLAEGGRLLAASRPGFASVMNRLWPVSAFGIVLVRGVDLQRTVYKGVADLEGAHPGVTGNLRQAAELRARLLVLAGALLLLGVWRHL